MDQDFGKRLEKARLARDMSIEQAAAAVRIRGTFLRALENGDLTKFPNAAYAKSFLLMYARFLGVDLKSVAAGIDTTTQMKVEGYQYLTSRAADLPKSKPEPEPGFSMAPAPKPSSSWLPLVVLAVLAAVIVTAVTVWSNLNRLDDSHRDGPAAGATPPGDSSAVQPIANTPDPTPATVPAATKPDGGGAAQPPQVAPSLEPAPPRPVVIAMPPPAANPPAPTTAEPVEDAEIPRARPISPVAKIAATDTAALADLAIPKPAVAAEEGDSPAPEPDTIILEPRRKTWVIIRSSAGGEKLYEDYLYPTAKPMRLPAGRYFIELKDADGVEISRNGKRIAYAAPGISID